MLILLVVACTGSSGPTPGSDEGSTQPTLGTPPADTGTSPFTGFTSDSSTPATDTADTHDTGTALFGLAGVTFAIDHDVLNIVSTVGIVDLMFSGWDRRILIEFLAETSTTVDMRFAMATSALGPAVQDPCEPTLDAVGADFTMSPEFTVSGLSYSGELLEGFPVPYEDGELVGTVDMTAGTLESLRFTALFLTEGLVPLLEPAGGADAVCLIAARFGTSCVPCPLSSSLHCLPHDVETRADRVPVTLTVRTEADIAADPTCP